MYLSRRNAGESPAGTSGVTCSMTGGGHVDRHEFRSQPRSAWPLPPGLSVWPDTRGHGHRVSVHRTAPARRGSHRAAGGRGAHAGASGRDIQEPTSQRQLFWPMRAAGRMFTRNCACRMIMICESRRRKRKNGTAPRTSPRGAAGRDGAAHCVPRRHDASSTVLYPESGCCSIRNR